MNSYERAIQDGDEPGAEARETALSCLQLRHIHVAEEQMLLSAQHEQQKKQGGAPTLVVFELTTLTMCSRKSSLRPELSEMHYVIHACRKLAQATCMLLCLLHANIIQALQLPCPDYPLEKRRNV